MKTVKIVVGKKGAVSYSVEGVKGDGCDRVPVVQSLERMLGEGRMERTAEYAEVEVCGSLEISQDV
jgi:hypothetical protein